MGVYRGIIRSKELILLRNPFFIFKPLLNPPQFTEIPLSCVSHIRLIGHKLILALPLLNKRSLSHWRMLNGAKSFVNLSYIIGFLLYTPGLTPAFQFLRFYRLLHRTYTRVLIQTRLTQRLTELSIFQINISARLRNSMRVVTHLFQILTFRVFVTV